eukprot:SAG31_NODE_249_length_19118_cov_47.456195_26_plen_112_part_00
MPGHGYCQETNGREATARYFPGCSSLQQCEQLCSEDAGCVAFAYAVDNGRSVLYTNGPACTLNCDEDRWQEDRQKIAKAGEECYFLVFVEIFLLNFPLLSRFHGTNRELRG